MHVSAPNPGRQSLCTSSISRRMSVWPGFLTILTFPLCPQGVASFHPEITLLSPTVSIPPYTGTVKGCDIAPLITFFLYSYEALLLISANYIQQPFYSTACITLCNLRAEHYFCLSTVQGRTRDTSPIPPSYRLSAPHLHLPSIYFSFTPV